MADDRVLKPRRGGIGCQINATGLTCLLQLKVQIYKVKRQIP